MAQPGPPIVEGFTPGAPYLVEGRKGKFVRKVKENPFVPIGCLATAGALIYGLISFKQGKSQRSQLMMRTRIAAQGFTVAAIMVGVVMSAMKSPTTSR